MSHFSLLIPLLGFLQPCLVAESKSKSPGYEGLPMETYTFGRWAEILQVLKYDGSKPLYVKRKKDKSVAKILASPRSGI